MGKHSQRKIKPRRGDTRLPKRILRIVFHAMFPKQRPKFVLETRFAVVGLLALNVPDYLIEVRCTDAECAMSFLPGKFDPWSLIHFDEFAFKRLTAFARASFGGRWNKM